MVHFNNMSLQPSYPTGLCAINSSSGMFLTSSFPSCPSPWRFSSLGCPHCSLDYCSSVLAGYFASCVTRPVHSSHCCTAYPSQHEQLMPLASSGISSSSSWTSGRFRTPCLAPEDLVLPDSQLHLHTAIPQPRACVSLKMVLVPLSLSFSLPWPQTGALVLYYYEDSLTKFSSRNL